MSDNLKKFYRAYKAWLDKGAPDHEPFSRDDGLCENLWIWCLQNESVTRNELLHEMYRQFRLAGRSITFPFGENRYRIDRLHDTQHLNPYRIKWVEEHAE